MSEGVGGILSVGVCTVLLKCVNSTKRFSAMRKDVFSFPLVENCARVLGVVSKELRFVAPVARVNAACSGNNIK